MADTVRGTFELSTTSAVTSSRNLRTSLKATDEWAHKVGNSLDRIGTAGQTTQVRKYRTQVRGLRTDLRGAAVQAERLDLALRGVGTARVRPHVDTSSINRAIVRVEVLARRMHALDRQRSNPRVNVNGGGGMSMAGGARGFRAGSGGAMVGTGGFNVAASGIRTVATVGAVALPVVQALTGAVGALAASLGAAGGAAAGIGVGGAASLAVGLGALVAVAKPAISRISEAYKAQTQFNVAQNDQIGIAKQNATAGEAVRQSELRLRDAQRQAKYAQQDLTRARRDARRELVDMSLAQDRSRLSEERARLTLRRSMAEQRRIALDPMASSTDKAEARLAVREASFGVREARIDRGRATADNRRAQRGGISGTQGVTSATRARQDAVRSVSEAKRGLAQAGAEMSAGASAIATAKQQLDQAFARAPRGTRQLLNDIREIRRLWGAADEGTKPGGVDPGVRAAQTNVVKMGRGAIGTLRDLTPTLGRVGRRASRAALREGAGVGRFLRGGRTKKFLTTSGAMFDENLGPARRSAQFVAETMMNISEASRPFLKQATSFIERWTRGWAVSTRDIGKTQTRLGGMVDHLKSWGKLTGAAGSLALDIGGNAAGPGKGGVDGMTRTLEKWDRWVTKNPRQVEAFFTRTVDSAKELAKAVASIAGALSKVATQLGPVMDRFAGLAQLAGSMGLLTPGVAALALGAVRGGRGARGGGAGGAGAGGMAGGAGGAGGGGGGMIFPWMAGRGGIAGGGAANGRLTSAFAGGMFGARRTGARAGGFGGRLGGWQGSRRLGQLSGGLSGVRTAAGRMGPKGFAAPVGRVGGAAARGAGKALLPIAAIMGVLDFIGEERGVPQKFQSAASGATLGLISKPRTRAQMDDVAGAYVDRYTGQLSEGNTQAGLRKDISTLKGGSKRIRGADFDFGSGEERERRIASAQREFKSALDERVQMLRDFRRQRNAILDETSTGKADKFAGEFQEGFGRKRKKMGDVAAFGSTVTGVLGKVGSMRKSGATSLAQQTLDWAREQAKANPKLQGEYNRLAGGIERRLGRLGRSVSVVQGQILDGTKGQWNSIADEMSSAARRGVSETSKEMRRLHALALGALTNMGYSKSDAQGFISGLNAGGEKATRANNAINMGAGGYAGAQAQAQKNINRTGDGWGIGDGTGNASAGSRSGGSANLMGAKAGMGVYAADAAGYGLSVSSGLRPGAITNAGNASYHGTGDALDLAGSPSAMMSFAKHAASKYGSSLEELIYSPLGWSIKNGSKTAAYAVADHYDHVHIADTAPGGTGGAKGVVGMPGAGTAGSVSSRASALPGTVGALSTAAGAAYATALNQRLAEAGGGGGTNFSGGGTPSANQKLGLRMMLAHGWGQDQWPSLKALWTGESNWDEKIVNTSSGATGIPQALPGNKMASAGADWKTNPATQIAWGLDYIAERYGSPSGAMSAWQGRSPHWYAKGGAGNYRQPHLIGVGDGQPSGGYERVTVERMRPSSRGGGGAAGRSIVLNIDLSGATITSEAHARELIGKAADHAARKLLAALEDAVPDSELG